MMVIYVAFMHRGTEVTNV